MRQLTTVKYTSNWGGEWLRKDKHWRYGVPPVGNASSSTRCRSLSASGSLAKNKYNGKRRDRCLVCPERVAHPGLWQFLFSIHSHASVTYYEATNRLPAQEPKSVVIEGTFPVRCENRHQRQLLVMTLWCIYSMNNNISPLLKSLKLIRIQELTEEEYFCTKDSAKVDFTFDNTSEAEPVVTFRYLGPEVNPDASKMGAYKKNKFNLSGSTSDQWLSSAPSFISEFGTSAGEVSPRS